MSHQLNPYLHRPGDARAAAEFYRDVFDGALTLMTFGDAGMPVADGWADKVMHAQVQTDAGLTLMLSDTPPGHETAHGEDVSVSLSGDDADALRRYWSRLSDGGTVHQELAPAPWGDTFGACHDRFAVSWLVNIAGSADAQ